MTNPAGQREAVFQRGLEAYRAGLHYEAHEFWEELWQDEDDDVRRPFLQALIQIASAVHKATNGVEPRGALRLLDRALGRLEPLPDAYGGIAVGALRAEIRRYRAEVDRALAADARLAAERAPVIERAAGTLEWAARPASAQPDPSAHFARALEAYRRGAFYEAHEHWEAIWRTESEGAHKRFVQGLILVAAAMHKLYAMKSPSGAIRLLERARDRLEGAAEGTDGIAVERLRDGIARTDAVLRSAVAGAGSIATDLAPPIERLAR